MRNNDVYYRTEVDRCLLCEEAPCSIACKKMDTASVIRSVKLNNISGAARRIPNTDICINCEAKNCIKVCNRGKIDSHIDIPFIVTHTAELCKDNDKSELPSLEIEFCGIKCINPFVMASSVITSSYDMCRAALQAGWGGISMKTITFLDIHEVSPRYDIPHKNEFPFSGFKNLEQLSQNEAEFDFEWMKRLKEEFPDRLIIASIMGQTEQEWEHLAKMAEMAKADIIECNFSCPQMVGKDLGSDIGQNASLIEEFTRACTSVVSIPVIAKLTPNVDKAYKFVEAAYRGGAAGVAGINTIKSLTTVDFNGKDDKRSIRGKTAVSGYSGKGVKPIALRFVREMEQAAENHLKDRSKINISGIGGIETWRDAADYILIGASNLQVCTAVMQFGQRIITDLTEGLRIYMSEHGIKNLKDMVGRALPNIVEPDELIRDTKTIPVIDYDKCVSCARCYLSCKDGGHQAIKFVHRKPVIDTDKCVGCHLCTFVCVTGAIHT